MDGGKSRIPLNRFLRLVELNTEGMFEDGGSSLSRLPIVLLKSPVELLRVLDVADVLWRIV